MSIGFFTLIIGRLFRVETLTLEKVGAVVMRFVLLLRYFHVCSHRQFSFTGSLLVASSDSSSNQPAGAPPSMNEDNHAPRPVWGDLLALLSAVFYALYVILLKVKIREESRIDMQLFFGFVGLVNILFCWPMGFLLHFIGAEPFELPSTQQAVISILLNVCMRSLSCVCRGGLMLVCRWG